MSDVKHKNLFEQLRMRILNGGYCVGASFPSENALVRKYGYSRNTVQHALVQLEREGLIARFPGRGTFVTKIGASRSIGLIVPGVALYPEFFQPIIATISRLSMAGGYQLISYEGYSVEAAVRRKEVCAFAESLLKKNVAGVIYEPMEMAHGRVFGNSQILTSFAKANISVVLLDSDLVLPPKHSGYDLVTIDNVDAGAQLAYHLLEVGARNICFMRGPELWPNVQKRMQGVMCAMVSSGKRWTDANVLVADPENVMAVRSFLRRHPSIDAFVCDCDTTAARLKQSLDKLGIAVPDEIKLAGFDDVKIARLMSPPLTTIHQPCEDLAHAAFDRLLARIANPELSPVTVSMLASLTVRESTVRHFGCGIGKALKACGRNVK